MLPKAARNCRRMARGVVESRFGEAREARARWEMSWGIRRDRFRREPQVAPLRYPGFPVELGGVGELHAPFLRKGAHTAVSSAAWQEIRVRSGRDDNFVSGASISTSWDSRCSARRLTSSRYGSSTTGGSSGRSAAGARWAALPGKQLPAAVFDGGE